MIMDSSAILNLTWCGCWAELVAKMERQKAQEANGKSVLERRLEVMALTSNRVHSREHDLRPDSAPESWQNPDISLLKFSRIIDLLEIKGFLS